MNIGSIKEKFPSLKDPELLQEIINSGTIVEFDPEQTVMDFGSSIKMLPFVLEGALKVLKKDDEGHELFIYFLYPGQSCAVTFQCCMAHVPSQIKAVAEDKAKLLLIPASKMDDWRSRFSDWNNFVLQTYTQRFSELMATLDSVVFNNLDERLFEYLQKKADIFDGREIVSTHQKIAYDLNTSREVISRLMKELERKGKIRLGRNKIELL